MSFDTYDNLECHLIDDTANNEASSPIRRRKTKKELRNEEVSQHVQDLIDTTSFHGISYIFDKRHPIRRVIWFFITTSAFIYSMLKVYESTVEHFSYPFSTARMRQYVDSIDFPAVSFCNVNDMRMSVLNGTNVDQAVLSGEASGVNGTEYVRLKRLSAHEIDEMLIDCEFDGQKCSTKNFTQFYAKQGDQCYSFNSGKPGHPLQTVSGPGKRRSLILTLDIQHYDYYRGGLKGGIHLILHGQGETPVRMRGEMISPGYSTYIQVEKKKIINLKPPFKTKCGSLKLKHFSQYSKSTCWLEQLTNYVTEKCNCKDAFMPGDFRVCSFEESALCMWMNWEHFDNKKLYNCPLSCEIDSYSGKTISRSLFPTEQYAKVLKEKLKNEKHLQKVDMGDATKFMRDNLLRVVIYYDNMSYELLEQVPSYDTLEWLGDVGGQIGLFIGAGAMSYFEVIDALALVVFARFFKRFTDEDLDDYEA
ncbi:acid-sensing ion channel 1C-like isoform X2 [Clytia hemisphaerica]|uniref:Uncharacterized protein n=1 Tax=Clytia hemisphaerica TaxID=252671 RepID=A0A7M5V7F3_9CNID